ncbi:MAG: hypothetical protein P4L91_18940 [Burkholderiaceae bacterium]|nr:hypothetical protein [Burkholderiaceae bacterium]
MKIFKGIRFKTSKSIGKPPWIDSALKCADLSLKILSCVAILVGGYWTYHIFDVGGGSDWMINLDMQTEVLPYDESFRLLVVHVHSKNPRNVSFKFRPKDGRYDLTFRKFVVLKENQVGDEDFGTVLNTVNLMPEDGIVWAPYAEFDDMRVLLVRKGIVVGVNAALHVNPDDDRDNDREDYVAVSRIVSIQ